MIPTPRPEPSPEDDRSPTDLLLLPPLFREHASAAVARINETIRTNERRALAGHPPVPCQIPGEEAEALAALAALVWGLTHLFGPKGKGGAKG